MLRANIGCDSWAAYSISIHLRDLGCGRHPVTNTPLPSWFLPVVRCWRSARLQTGSGKQWRVERFAELARRLTASGGLLPGARVAVLAAGHERGQAQPLLEAIPQSRLIDLVGRVDLLTAAAVLGRCALFIGNDTGLMHIAAACGTPTLGLFGPSPSCQYAPWGPRAAFVCSSDSPETMFGPGFDHRTTDTLMDGLSLAAAEAASCRLWDRVASAAA